MIILPKGSKLPDGMSFREMQDALKLPTECTKLVGDLVSLDDDLGHVIKAYVFSHEDAYPVLAGRLRNEVQHD